MPMRAEHVAHGVAGRGLDLDHLGAPVGQQGGGRRGRHPHPELDHPEAGEGGEPVRAVGRSRRRHRSGRRRPARRRSSFTHLAGGVDGAARRRTRPPGAPCSWPSGSRLHPMISAPVTGAPGPEHHEGHAHLAQALVGDADHRRLADVRVPEQGVLDLGRVGVEAADDEHVLGPARRCAGSRRRRPPRGRRCAASRRRTAPAAVASGSSR